MYYTPPKDENGNPYYVPIVAKNKDYVLGYLKGIETSKDIIEDVMESINIKVDLGPMDIVLDSTRYNDILENGKHESDMTEDELKEYVFGIMEEISDKMLDDNPENDVLGDAVLKVECSCGLGFHYWTTLESIPSHTFCCSNCGKYLIHYTGIDEYEFEYNEGR